MVPAVIAGNVYAEDGLVKHPTYMFQIAASQNRHVIFRTFASYKIDQDSIDKNVELFEEINIHIIKNKAVALEDFDSIDLQFQQHQSISALMYYETEQNERIEIEFPIKHINIQKERKLFQVETGPILIPSECPADRLSAQTCFLDTAFVHFNRLDRAEVTINAITCIGQKKVRFFSHVKKLKARIVLMANDCKRQ